MDYPRDFPNDLKPPVDAAIHTAEIAFIDAKELAGPRFQYEAERLILGYVEAVFFGFAVQAVEAVKQGAWTGERVRQALPKFLEDLGHRAYFDKHPDPGAHHRAEYFSTTLRNESKSWKGWRAIHKGLKQAAEQREASADGGGASMPKRGYRKQVQDWMEREQLETVEHAARRLRLSKSALKSIMSSKGKLRYSQATLERVLKEIEYKQEG